MKYIGIPTCPYCKKRVNIIRAWSVKKHGEFMCPRCKGISNIFLSPLVYVMAVLAISAAFLIYFFQKFVSDSLNLWSILQVFLPFAAFFVISLFMVYLEKPVIKRVRKTADGRYYDQNGNELKMRMGKLVSAAKAGAPTDFGDTGALYTANDMTGRENGQTGSAPISLNLAQTEFADDESLYADAAAKLGREFTTEFDPKSLRFPENDEGLPEPKNMKRDRQQEAVKADEVFAQPTLKSADAPVRIVKKEPIRPMRAAGIAKPAMEKSVDEALDAAPSPAAKPPAPAFKEEREKPIIAVNGTDKPAARVPAPKKIMAEPVQIPKPFAQEVAPEIPAAKPAPAVSEIFAKPEMPKTPAAPSRQAAPKPAAQRVAPGRIDIDMGIPKSQPAAEEPARQRPRVRPQAEPEEQQGNFKPVSGLDDLFEEYSKRVAEEEKGRTNREEGTFRKL